MIAFSLFAVLLRLIGTLGGTQRRPARPVPARHDAPPPEPTPPASTLTTPTPTALTPAEPAPAEPMPAEPTSAEPMPAAPPEPYDGPSDGDDRHHGHDGDAVHAWRDEVDRPGGMDGGAEHPESLTAVLDPAAEEYLAWLADHHWPADEYLELERDWELELAWQSERNRPAGLEQYEPYEPTPIRSSCPKCQRHGEDVWPCWTCGRLLHSACGHGLRRRPVKRPYRTRDMNAEAVTAEWICTDCSCVVGLDVERGGDERPGSRDCDG